MCAVDTLTGTLVQRPLSNLPFVEWKRGQDTLFSPVHIDQASQAQGKMGQKVSFKIVTNPYGPHIISDTGFAKLLDI